MPMEWTWLVDSETALTVSAAVMSARNFDRSATPAFLAKSTRESSV